MRLRLTRIKEPATRLVCFVAGLALFLAVLEGFARRNETLLAGASHRALAKLAMFERHPRVELLFLGTSRTQDGVSPDLVTRGLKGVAPELGEVPGYNAAFTGSSLGALTSLAPRFGFRNDLRVVVIELSAPQLLNEPATWEEPDKAMVTLEDKFEDWSRQVCLIRYRKALLTDNLGRLPALLLFSKSLGGWETKGNDQVASWLGRKEPPATGFEPARWVPEIISPDRPAQTLDSTHEAAAAQLTSLVRQFGEHGIKVVFAIPPLTQGYQGTGERNELRGLAAEVARRGGSEVWNFASLPLPDSFFRDPSHLNKEGRAQYSLALAVQLARLLKDK